MFFIAGIRIETMPTLFRPCFLARAVLTLFYLSLIIPFASFLDSSMAERAAVNR